MYELVQVAENSFYMDCPTKVGFYKISSNEVVLIDSGSDKDAAKKVKKILDGQGWNLKAIYNTHSHADHIGGNQYLQNQTKCKIYSPGIEQAFTAHPILEPTMLYGGHALKELHNKFLMAKESSAEYLTKEKLPEGLEILNLPGHCYDMVGFRTKDDVIFLADCLSSEETIEKYQIGFVYDVQAYIDTLYMVKNLDAKCFIPSHAPETNEIVALAQLNIDKTLHVAEVIKDLLKEPMTFEELLSKIFERFELTMTLPQRFLIGATVKSYLTYLKNKSQVDYCFKDNKMLWHSSVNAIAG